MMEVLKPPSLPELLRDQTLMEGGFTQRNIRDIAAQRIEEDLAKIVNLRQALQYIEKNGCDFCSEVAEKALHTGGGL